MANKLRDLEIGEVSVVDRGANQHAHVKLFKRDSSDFAAELDAALVEVQKWFEDDESGSEHIEKTTARDGQSVEFRKNEGNMSFASETILAIAKNAVNGATNPHTRSVYHSEITKRAEAVRKAGESPQQAYARFITEDPDGRTLIRAHYLAKADEPVAKAAGAPDDAHGAEAKRCPSYGLLLQHAQDLQSANPKLSKQQAFSAVYSDPNHKPLVAQYMAEKRVG